MDNRRSALRAAPSEALFPSSKRVKVVAAATAFTATSAAAARRAALVARAHEAQVHLLHVVPPAGRSAVVLRALLAQTRPSAGEAATRLRQSAARIGAEYGIAVGTHLGVGRTSEGITVLAHAAQANLVVLGNSGDGFLADLLRTNMAGRVLRRAKLPVLAVSRSVQTPYRRVLLASDLTPPTARAGLLARRLFPEATFAVFHAPESPYDGMPALTTEGANAVKDYRDRVVREGRERLGLFVREAELGGDTLLRVAFKHPALGVREQAAALDADLVVLHPTQGWFSGGVTDQLLGDPPCDLLLVP